MRPTTWWERLLWLLSPFRYIQCKALLPFRHGNGGAYCIRCKWHPGQHETNDGERFTDSQSMNNYEDKK